MSILIPPAKNRCAFQRQSAKIDCEIIIRGNITVCSYVIERLASQKQNKASLFLNCKDPGPFGDTKDEFVLATPRKQSKTRWWNNTALQNVKPHIIKNKNLLPRL